MLTRLSDRIPRINFHGGRRTVAVGFVAGVGAFLLTTHEGATLYNGFMKALAATLLTMVVFAVADNFFTRDQKVKEATAHAGPDGIDVGVTFEDKIAEAVDEVRQGIKEQMGIVDGRLGRLEEAIFRRAATSADDDE